MRAIKVKEMVLGSGMPKVCVSIMEAHHEAIMKKAWGLMACGVDCIEWRADAFKLLKSPEAIKTTLFELRAVLGATPLIFTLRTAAEGGLATMTEDDYASILKSVTALQMVDLIDLEMTMPQAIKEEILSHAKACRCLVIGSKHDFLKTDALEVLLKDLADMEAFGVDVIKLACTAQTKQDVLNLLLATQIHYDKPGTAPLITMSMGQIGQISRVLGAFCGSALTFGAFGDSSAPGQMDLMTLKKALELLAPIET